MVQNVKQLIESLLGNLKIPQNDVLDNKNIQ